MILTKKKTFLFIKIQKKIAAYLENLRNFIDLIRIQKTLSLVRFTQIRNFVIFIVSPMLHTQKYNVSNAFEMILLKLSLYAEFSP